jgi:transposase
VNRTYAEMADHCGAGVLPARPRKPRDKAKVEACVLIVERYLLGRLRHRRFYSLGELNQAIQEMLIHLNELPPLRRLGVTRRHLLEELDRPVLKPLPAEPYVYAEWRLRRAGLDYHIDVDGHYYSVPHRFANEELSVRLTARMVEVFRKGERIAVHLRGSGNHKHTTVQEHMPSSHRRFADWTIERIHRDAAAIGVSTKMLCRLILESRQHPEQGFRACMGIIRLVKSYCGARVEAACLRGAGDRRPDLWFRQIHPTQQSRSPGSHQACVARKLTPTALATARPVQCVAVPGACEQGRASTLATISGGSGSLPGLRVLSRRNPSR